MLAVVLAALVFAVGGTAEAAEHDHHGAAPTAQVDHSPTHHAQSDQDDDGAGLDGSCHCMSAACTPALPLVLSDYHVTLPRSRPAVPGALAALALASVGPPAEPPRI